MKIVFMGTPEFARTTLSCLAESEHQVLAVVTGPDKPSGRGRKMLPTPCKQEALAHSFPVLTPRSLKSKEFREQLAKLNADLFVVVAFRVLPESVFSLPAKGSINIHGSLLPKYRGAAPINWALINGDSETGLTSFFLKKRVDTGDIIAQQKVPIDPEDSFDTLYQKMSEVSGPFLLRTLEMIESGQSEPIEQDESLATGAPKLNPADGLLDFNRPAEVVNNQIRGMTSRPGAYSFFRGKVVKLIKAHPVDEAAHPLDQSLEPGTVIPNRKRLMIRCATGALEIARLLPEGRKPMDGISFINGFKPDAGEKFTHQDSVVR